MVDAGSTQPPPPPVDEKLRGRCDSFVVETHVEYPTDTRLLFDALRKVADLLVQLCRSYDVQESISRSDIQSLKKRWRRIQKLKHSTSKDESKRTERQQEIIGAYQAYLDLAIILLERAEQKLVELEKKSGMENDKILKIKNFAQNKSFSF